MMETNEIVNRVAQSPLITIDLASFHTPGDRVVYDLKNDLYEGIILREKDFRQHIKSHDWSQYGDKHVAVHCSADAIVPNWAFMLLAVNLEPYAKTIVFGDQNALETELFRKALDKLDLAELSGKKVVIKGCGDLKIPVSAYVEVTRVLRPVVSSIMYGEPCSTVPVYKSKPKRS